MKTKSYQGKVVKQVFGSGSKSQHDAVMLITENDGDLKLRRLGANPFVDKQLEELVGTEIRCTGTAEGSTLFIDAWEATEGQMETRSTKQGTGKSTKNSKSASEGSSTEKETEAPPSTKKRAIKKRDADK